MSPSPAAATALPFPLIDGLSAEHSLSLSTDGALPPGHREAARAWDGAHPLPSPFRVRLGATRLKDEAIVHIIATAIEKVALRGDALTRADLETLGLAPAEIDRNFAAGLRLAVMRHPVLLREAA